MEVDCGRNLLQGSLMSLPLIKYHMEHAAPQKGKGYSMNAVFSGFVCFFCFVLSGNLSHRHPLPHTYQNSQKESRYSIKHIL